MATPLMNLDLPVVGVTIGPTWASQLNTALGTIDIHDHTTGKGTKVPTAGLNINADLGYGNNNAISVKSIRYQSQGSTLVSASDKECIYSVSGSLYYNNSAGTPIQITSGSGINIASTGTIGGDYGGVGVTAAVTYTNATKIFAFLQGAGSTAKIAAGEYILFETATATNAVTLKSPTSLAASYSLTFPTSLPASTLPVLISSTGALSSGQITTAQITDLNVTNDKLANTTINVAKFASRPSNSVTGGVFTTSSSTLVDVTGYTVTFTPVGSLVCLSAFSSASFDSYISCDTASASNPYLSVIQIQSNGVSVHNFQIGSTVGGASGGSVYYSPSIVNCIFTVTPGVSTTVKIQARRVSSSSSITFSNFSFRVVEI